MSQFEATCKAVGLPTPVTEFRFHPERKWRIDWAFPEVKLGVEQEGAVWAYGRHNRASGFVKDLEKYNSAAELGWRILRYQPNKIDFDQIKRTYEGIKNANV